MVDFFNQIIWGNSIYNYFISFLVILIFIGFGKIFSMFIVKIIKSVASKTKTIFDDVLISILEKPMVFALFIAGFAMAKTWIIFSERGEQIYANIIEVLIVLLIIWVIIRFIDAIMEHYLKPLMGKEDSGIDDHILPFARTTVKVIVVIIGGIFLIKEMGYDVTSLVAGLGIGGLAFALAAQPLLSNLFGGIAIIADKPFKVGDRVRIDERFEGYVQHIGMRSTVIKTPVETMVHIPNSIIAATAVENKSRENRDHAIRILFNLGVVYSTPAEKMKEAIDIIKDILEKHPAIIKDDPKVKYIVGFNEFKDSALNIYIEYSFNQAYGVTKTKTEINFSIKEAFEKAGIEFAYPTQTIHLKQ